VVVVAVVVDEPEPRLLIASTKEEKATNLVPNKQASKQATTPLRRTASELVVVDVVKTEDPPP